MRLMLACAAAVLAAASFASAEAAPATSALKAASLARPADLVVNAGGKVRRYARVRDCRPYNGPYGYYGNPWCEGGWKYAEDRAASYGYWYAPRYRYWRR